MSALADLASLQNRSQRHSFLRTYVAFALLPHVFVECPNGAEAGQSL
jgi:hypothetical protein